MSGDNPFKSTNSHLSELDQASFSSTLTFVSDYFSAPKPNELKTSNHISPSISSINHNKRKKSRVYDAEKLPSVCLNTSQSNRTMSSNSSNFTLYKRRHVMLGIAILGCLLASMQWFQYASIGGKMALFMDVPYEQIHLLAFPHPIINTLGALYTARFAYTNSLQALLCIGLSSNLLAYSLKLLALYSPVPQYSYALVGQILAAIAQVHLQIVPVQVLQRWYSTRHSLHIQSLRFLLPMVGAMISFVVFPLCSYYLHLHSAILGATIHQRVHVYSQIHNELLQTMKAPHIVLTTLSAILLALALIFFEDYPAHPPSLNALVRTQQTTMINLDAPCIFKNPKLFSVMTFGAINSMAIYTVLIHFDEMILIEFPGDELRVTTLALSFLGGGFLGAFCCIWLLKLRPLIKEISILFYGMSTIFWILFMFRLHFSSFNLVGTKLDYLVNGLEFSNSLLLHFYTCLLGFFLFGFWPVRVSFAVRMGVPYHSTIIEEMSQATCDICIFFIYFFYSIVIADSGTIAANFSIMLFLATGLFILGILQPEDNNEQTQPLLPVTRSKTSANQTKLSNQYFKNTYIVL